MAISITEASELKRAVLDNFGVTLHFHDGCGGQYFTLDERNEEIKRFIESYFDKKGITVTFIARGNTVLCRRQQCLTGFQEHSSFSVKRQWTG